MSDSESVYCGQCKKEVCYHFDPIRHGRQLLYTVFSLGLWLPIWACMVFAPSKICDECGKPIWNEQPAKAVPARRSAS